MRLIKHILMLTKIIKIVLEVQAAVVACSALLPLAAEAWGVLRIRTTHQNPKSVNKLRQSESRNGVGMGRYVDLKGTCTIVSGLTHLNAFDTCL